MDQKLRDEITDLADIAAAYGWSDSILYLEISTQFPELMPIEIDELVATYGTHS